MKLFTITLRWILNQLNAHKENSLKFTLSRSPSILTADIECLIWNHGLKNKLRRVIAFPHIIRSKHWMNIIYTKQFVKFHQDFKQANYTDEMWSMY